MAKGEVQIFVNGEEKSEPKGDIKFDRLVELAYPGADPASGYRVTYEKGQSGQYGDLPYAGTVHVHEKMIFNASPTGLS